MADVPLMTNPMTTAGDVIYGGASGAPTRLAIGTAGQVLKVNGGATAVEWDDETGGAGTTPDTDRVVRTSADYTITGAGSTTFADVDSTNVTITLSTGANRVMVGAVGSAGVDNAAGILMFDVTVDTVREGQTAGLFRFHSAATSEEFPVNFTHLTDTLSAGNHTFRLQWRQTNTSHTATLRASAAVTPLVFWAVEVA